MLSPSEDSTATESFDDDPIGPTPSIEDVTSGYVITAADAAEWVSQWEADDSDFDDLGPEPLVYLSNRRWRFVRYVLREPGQPWSEVQRHYERPAL